MLAEGNGSGGLEAGRPVGGANGEAFISLRLESLCEMICMPKVVRVDLGAAKLGATSQWQSINVLSRLFCVCIPREMATVNKNVQNQEAR